MRSSAVANVWAKSSFITNEGLFKYALVTAVVGATVTLTPVTRPLANYAQYRIQITTGVTDVAGNAIATTSVRPLDQAVANFTSFAPLGTVLVAMLGIGVAEGSGLIAVALRGLFLVQGDRLDVAYVRRWIEAIGFFASSRPKYCRETMMPRSSAFTWSTGRLAVR